MISAKLYKRFFAYLIDLLACTCASFSLLCFIFLKWSDLLYLYIILGFVFTYIFYFVFLPLINFLSKGYSLGYAIFGIKIVNKANANLSFKQLYIKSCIEVFIFLYLIDCLFILTNRTEISAIDQW